LIGLDGVGAVGRRVDDHAHAAHAVRPLAAEDPYRLGVVDENIVDGSGSFLASDWDEARFQTGTLSSGERWVFGLAWVVESRLSDSVVLLIVNLGLLW
jgi:hypothetical protein